jgi:Phage integrase, N-terminal SAM-like domain
MERQALRTQVDVSAVAESAPGAVFFATRRKTMSTVNLNRTVLVSATESPFEEAHMAAAAFLARYSGRTLETYRFDLRSYFEWCTGVGLAVLEAKRPHIELWRAASEERGLAASTIDRRRRRAAA